MHYNVSEYNSGSPNVHLKLQLQETNRNACKILRATAGNTNAATQSSYMPTDVATPYMISAR